MLGSFDQLTDHGLDDANVAVEKPAEGTAGEGDPQVACHADHDHAEHGAEAADEQDGLAANAVGEATPVHAREGLGEREGRDEEAGVEGGIFLLADLESLDKCPGVGEDGGQGDGFREADNRWAAVSVMRMR